MTTFLEVTTRLLSGFWVTCEIFLVTLAAALPLGLLVSFCTMSRFRPLRYAVRGFVWIIRSTPLMLQVILVFYGPGLIWGGRAMGRTEAVLAAFIMNYACYFSEIYRGGILSVPQGQREAAEVLGLTRTQTFFRVTLLQVVKRIVPPMGNEIITLVKDTSLARIIAVREIIMVAQEYISADALIWPLFYSGAFYLLFCGALTLLLGRAERALDYFRV